MAWGGTSVGNR